MTVHREEVHKRVKGSLMQDESWWHLCYDNDADAFWIEHDWDRVDPYNLAAKADVGSRRLSLEEYSGPGADQIPNLISKLRSKSKSSGKN